MKKIFKIIGIIVIVIVVLIGAVFGYTKIKQSMMNNERRNANTLMEYVKTHSWEYLDCSDSNCLDMHFEENKFICDIDYNNIKYFQSGYFVTKNNEIYDISFDKLYSNNQNCKKREIDIDVSNIQDYYIFSKNNKIYNVRDLEEEYITDYSQIYLLDKNIIKIISSDYDNGKINVLVFKDNNIYKQTYNITNGENGFNKITFEKEELYKSLEEYGNIKYITFEPYLYTNSGKNIQLEENTITTIFSDKGYYYLEEIITDECKKYQDIECELEFKESEIYKRFSNDVKYVGQTYTILSDNSVIQTKYLTYPLDKDLRN
ncbi:MAG TPA: hypothetical protein IAB65_05935 [Candidatus Onthocola stercorigallinarum]|nr:hypothetical protein [Candidatus Onthocola stercorigallinarum]